MLITANYKPTTGCKSKSCTQEREEAAVRSRARGRLTQKEKEVSIHGTMANSMRLLRGWRLLAIAIDPDRLAETHDAKNAPEREKDEQSAPPDSSQRDRDKWR
jgi:hypothetical protein